MSQPSPLRKFLRLSLVGSGVLMAVSAITGIVSAYVLLEPSDAQAVDITPGDFVGFYTVIFVVGAALIYIGVRKLKP